MKKRIELLKRQGARIAVVTAGALIMSLAASFSAPSFRVNAEETKEEIEQQKEEAEEGKAEAEAAIEKYRKKIDKLTVKIQELDTKMTDISAKIVDKKAQADQLKVEIDETQKLLAEAQVSESNQYVAMKKRIQYLYEEGDVEYIDALMSSASFEDSLNKSEYVDQISSYDQKQLDKFVKTKNDIKSYEQTLADDLVEVEAVQAELEQQQADLDEVIGLKYEEINKYNGDIEVQQAVAADFANKEAELDDKLAQIAKEEEQRRREEEERRRQEEQSQSGDGDDDSDSDDGNDDFVPGSGQFLWPVSTGGVITDYYGPREAPTAGASTWHRGIDIGCGYGDAIVAADSGVVICAEWGESGGNYVMIDHGNGYVTMYLHNSSLAVSVGDNVAQGETIAYAGSTGYSTGTHCHFSILYNGEYVNPLDYL